MKHKYTLILLFVVVISFSLLGSLFPAEGFEQLPVPQCKNEVGESKSCDDDDYMLKSQIVPPVCPSCPPYLCDTNEETVSQTATPASQTATPASQTESANKQSNYSFKQTTETKEPKESSGLLSMFNRSDKGSGQGSGQGFGQGSGQGFGQGSGQGSGILSGFNKSNNQTDLSEYKQEIEKLKEQLKELKQYDGNAPPCPACERCPEPSFDCKKVPNYRSASVGNYLPMPILNDFSRFT